MSFRNLSLGLVGLLLTLFAWQNWAAIRGPVGEDVEALASRFLWLDLAVAPGVVLLGACVLLALLYAGYTAQVRTSALVENRRWAREVESARKLADEAEASRFEQLRAAMETQLEALERGVREQMEESHNVLAAHIAELEDRVVREDARAGATSSTSAVADGEGG